MQVRQKYAIDDPRHEFINIEEAVAKNLSFYPLYQPWRNMVVRNW